MLGAQISLVVAASNGGWAPVTMTNVSFLLLKHGAWTTGLVLVNEPLDLQHSKLSRMIAAKISFYA